MELLNRLLGRNKTTVDEQPSQVHKQKTLSSNVEVELRELCGNKAHSEYPYLRIDYSPSSRYPAVDFTPWIAQKLSEKRFDEIAFLLVQLTLANPGMGIGTNPDYWKNRWTETAIDICNIDLHKFIDCEDEIAFLDLHAALFPYVLHGALDGFALVNLHIDYLVRAMSPYVFNVRDIETRVDAANKFIKKMRRELKDTNSTAWSDYPLFKVDKVTETLRPNPPAYELRNVLRGISIGARQMFFGTLKDGVGQGHWIARPFGIDEDKAGIELVNCELGTFESDPVLILTTYRKDELFKALAGHPIKQGWNKKYIIKYMTQNAPDVVTNLTSGRQVFSINPEVKTDGLELAEWLNKTKVRIQLSIGFMNGLS